MPNGIISTNLLAENIVIDLKVYDAGMDSCCGIEKSRLRAKVWKEIVGDI